MSEWLEILKLLGPTATLIGFFVWRDYHREKRMSARLDLLEDYQKTELRDIAVASNAALMANTEALRAFRIEKEKCTALKREAV